MHNQLIINDADSGECPFLDTHCPEMDTLALSYPSSMRCRTPQVHYTALLGYAFLFISLNRVKLRYYVLQGIYVLHIFAAKM